MLDFEEVRFLSFVPSGSKKPSIAFNISGYYEIAIEFTPAEGNSEIWALSYPYSGEGLRKIANGCCPKNFRTLDGDIAIFYSNLTKTKINYRLLSEEYSIEYNVSSISGTDIELLSVNKYYLPFDDTGRPETRSYYGYYILIYQDSGVIKYLTSTLIDTYPPKQKVALSTENISFDIGLSGIEWFKDELDVLDLSIETLGLTIGLSGIEWEEIGSPTVKKEETLNLNISLDSITWQEIITIQEQLTTETLGLDIGLTSILWVEI